MSRIRTSRVVLVLSALALAAVAPILASAAWSLRAGAEAASRGDHLQAAQAFEAAAHKLPWREDLWERAGISAFEGGDALEATRLLMEARAREALSATGWAALGSAQWAAGNPEEAFIDWQQGTERYPEAATLWDRLAAAYHFKGDFAAEEAALRRRLSLADDAAAQYRLGLLLMLTDAQGAREALQSAAALNQEVLPAATTLRAALSAAAVEDDHAGQMVVIGRSLGLVEEWSLAANAFASAVEADSTNAEARAWLGEARQHLSQDGRPDLDAAASMDPGSTVVHTLRGLYWRRQGNLSQSLMEYLRAVELEPRNAALQSLAGEAYTASGDLVGALTAYQTAVELAPRDSTYWSQLALFCADNGVQVLDLGVEAGLKAVELAPRDSRALDALGWAYAQGGYLTKAEQALLQALESQPANALAHLHLGLTYMRWGQGQLAMQHLQQAVQSDDGGAAGQAAAELLRTYFPAQQ